MRSLVEMERLFAGLSAGQRVEVAVRAALVGCWEWRFVGWAARWLDGSDRSWVSAELSVARSTGAAWRAAGAAAFLAAGPADRAARVTAKLAAAEAAARAEWVVAAQPPERRVDLRVLTGDVRAGMVRPRLPVTAYFVGGPRAGSVEVIPALIQELRFADAVVYRRAEPAGWVALTGRATYEFVDGLPWRRGAAGVRPEDFA